MTLALTREHRDLRDAVRAFAGRRLTSEVLRAAVDAEEETLPGSWEPLAAQGLLGLHLPEKDGGSGYGLPELAVVLEELGRHLVPGPFLPTVLASAVLDRADHRTHLPALADGSATAAVSLGPGTLTATAASDGSLTLTGAPEPVSGGATASHFVLPCRTADRTVWTVLPREALDVTPAGSLDLTRRLVRVRAEQTRVPAADVLGALDPSLPLDLAAVLFAAEASGTADRATATAAEYAAVREQFGRPVGQFQGVKHRCARMLVRTETARACAWDAARAQADPEAGADEASLAAAVAGATAVEAALSTAKDCIQTLGGIGFTWEHDAGLHLRRARSQRSLLGSTASWHRRVAALTGKGARRRLAVDLPPEAEERRAAVRAELAPARGMEEPERRRWLAEHGYTAPHLPAPWGKDADAVGQLVIEEEMEAASLAAADLVIGAWVVPTLVAHGSPAQRERFLPPTLRGDLVWCQLFSEPGAGSDLAALTTRAERTDGGWLVTGQKVWTSMAREADWAILLARTDPDAPKHKGLSYFLLDMRSPGIDIRPLRELTGEALFNEVFLDGVFLPDELLVADPGQGWELARTTLANERVSLSGGSSLGSGGETLLRLHARTDPEDEGERQGRRTELGRILSDAQALGLLGLRRTLRSLSGDRPGAEASIAKLLGVEHTQEIWETAVEWQGTAALTASRPGSPGARRGGEQRDAAWMFLNTRCLSIAGGTTDIQLNIIAERLLKLPRDPAPVPDGRTGKGNRP